MNSKIQRLEAFSGIDLYPVTDQSQSNGRSNDEVLAAIIGGGARIVQLREKELSKKAFYEMACRFRKATSDADILLIINDHLDIALACNADGVHLGQDDLPLPAARKLAPDLIIGVSTHDLPEALAARDGGADYINIGPIFPTGTKQVPTLPRTPQAIREVAPHLHVPFTVMGGINRGNIVQVLEAGARKIAVVTAVTKAPDIAAAVRGLRGQIRSYESFH